MRGTRGGIARLRSALEFSDATAVGFRPGGGGFLILAAQQRKSWLVTTTGFREDPAGRGTQVKVVLRYDIPGGKLGQGLAKLLGSEPGQQFDADLRRLKMFLETGEVSRTDGQSAGANRDTTGQMSTNDAILDLSVSERRLKPCPTQVVKTLLEPFAVESPAIERVREGLAPLASRQAARANGTGVSGRRPFCLTPVLHGFIGEDAVKQTSLFVDIDAHDVQ